MVYLPIHLREHRHVDQYQRIWPYRTYCRRRRPDSGWLWLDQAAQVSEPQAPCIVY